MRKLLVAATFISLGVAAQPEQAKTWTYRKDDPKTHKHVIAIDAKSFAAVGDGHTFQLHDMTLRLYDSGGVPYQTINSKEAVLDSQSATLRYGQKTLDLRSPAK